MEKTASRMLVTSFNDQGSRDGEIADTGSTLFSPSVIYTCLPYIVVIVLNVVFRFATFDNGECRIGMETAPMVALILVDFFVNCVLTVQFLHPLSGRAIVVQEESEVKILLTVLVLHWVTSKDNVSTTASHPSFPNQPPPSRSSRPRRTQTPHPDIENFEVGLSDYMRKGGVTTLVTAASHDFDEDEDGDGIREAVPPNTIKVECEHTQEVVEVVQLVGDSRDFAEEKEREASGSRSQEREACSEDSKGRRDSLAALC
ncbi:hypothetical protein HYFRA_00009995 [Hymenoscyphus fraxineus]|uniref:Transmembrane protein n=1 Tax=Hymenoscyphus fraxineus TaxID=746836 RepID=A0A9N9PHU6_9HELO|nr:hypothetical protein HYFRA_00009995 [Hymenoscyphus fraxineus]